MQADYDENLKKITKGKPNSQLTEGIRHAQRLAIKGDGSDGQELVESGQRYEIGSLTKIFTTSLLTKYLTTGQLKLEDSLATFFPDLPRDVYNPTIRRLATHMSGYQPFSPQ